MMATAMKPAPAGGFKVKMPVVRKADWTPRFLGTEEPALAEIMDDPITRSLMASDRISLDHVMDVLREARARLAD